MSKSAETTAAAGQDTHDTASGPTDQGAHGTTSGSKLIGALKDAAIAGVIALLLSIPILSFRTIPGDGGLAMYSRWREVAIAVAAVFAGRLLLNLFWWSQSGTPSSAKASALKSVGTLLSSSTRFIAPAVIIFAFLLPFMPFSNRYIMELAVLVLTYVMLGWGLNIVVGLAGLLDLGYVAFYAVGAYSFALLATTFGWSFWICLPLAGILAAMWGVILGFPVLRLRGDYLAIVTLAFGEIVRIVLLNWYTFTGGPDGISSIPRPTFFGLEFKRFGDNTFAQYFGLEYSSLHRIIFLFYIILILALITNFATMKLRRLPIGRAWEALREDEIACKALGINTTTTKLSAFAIGAMFGGFAGSFFATKQGFISPESFVFLESALILAIVVLGGMGSQIGIAIAAVAMIGGIELFRDLAEYRMLIFGLAMVLIMVWKPRGLVGTRTPSIFLKEKKTISADLVQEGHG